LPPAFDYRTIYGEGSISEETEFIRTGITGAYLATELLGTDFNRFDSLGLRIAVRAITHATLSLQAFLRDDQPFSDLPRLLGLRNRAQWLTLNLLKPDINWAVVSDELSEENELVFNVICLSLRNYNNLVLFPLPPASGLDTELALKLKTVIQLLQQCNENTTSWTRLLLWAVVLGGISDSRRSARSWYLQEFNSILARNFPEMTKWSHVESCLTSFMWIRDVLNDEAIEFWADSRSV
jgi:hypothetical protein